MKLLLVNDRGEVVDDFDLEGYDFSNGIARADLMAELMTMIANAES